MLKSLFHWKVLVSLVLAALVFVGLVWLTFRWLEVHTNHGKEVAVPNVINKSVHEAIKILDDSGLDYEVDSFKYDPKYKPFQVLQIYPVPGSHVKDGRAIILKVNPKTYAKVSVPDIIDRYKGLAFRQLQQVGLKVGDTIYEPSIQRDAVLRMMYNGATLKPGTLLPRFSTIDLVIGAGPKRNISVPNLVGLTVQEAKAIIAQNLFEIGLIEHEDGGKDDSDIVYFQDPASFNVRDQGMQIDLWASKKTPAEMRAKIEQLNSIYRVQIDTTVVQRSYTEPVYVEPRQTPSSQEEPVNPKPAVPKEAPKQETQKQEPAKTEAAKPKPATTAAAQKTTPAKTTPASTDKPKARKVVE